HHHDSISPQLPPYLHVEHLSMMNWHTLCLRLWVVDFMASIKKADYVSAKEELTLRRTTSRVTE
ncbi:hypothetical protein ABR853_07860, partial [Aeromonas caviae]|uniref:hypothetical protein n=1 Tax=Aeromonas caviae TaxID=648 RepID=UPI0033061512